MNECEKVSDQTLLIVGRGSIGKKHELNARSLGTNVVTVDPVPEAEADYLTIAEAIAAHHPKYFSHALIASPVGTHLSTLLELLQADVPFILVEKPLVLPEELQTVKTLASSLTTQTVVIGFNWRFNSVVQSLKQQIIEGRIGQIRVAQLWAREWLTRYQGNVVLESGSHIIDTARYVLGDLRFVGSHVTTFGILGETDEAATVLFEGENGMHVSTHVNFINPASYDYSILVQGDKDTVIVTPDRFEPMHEHELRAFLRKDTERLATIEDGIGNLELIGAALQRSQEQTCTI